MECYRLFPRWSAEEAEHSELSQCRLALHLVALRSRLPPREDEHPAPFLSAVLCLSLPFSALFSASLRLCGEAGAYPAGSITALIDPCDLGSLQSGPYA